jgi:hypothetical protein
VPDLNRKDKVYFIGVPDLNRTDTVCFIGVLDLNGRIRYVL